MSEQRVDSPGRLILSLADNPVELREYIPEDAEAIFKLIDYDRAHLSQFDDTTAIKYPSVERVRDSIVHPIDPGKLRLGIWVADIMVGSNNLRIQGGGRAELGSWVGKQYISHNYAAYGRAVLIDYAFGTLHLKELFSMVTVGNAASRTSVERSGLSLRDTIENTWVLSIRNPGGAQ